MPPAVPATYPCRGRDDPRCGVGHPCPFMSDIPSKTSPVVRARFRTLTSSSLFLASMHPTVLRLLYCPRATSAIGAAALPHLPSRRRRRAARTQPSAGGHRAVGPFADCVSDPSDRPDVGSVIDCGASGRQEDWYVSSVRRSGRRNAGSTGRQSSTTKRHLLVGSISLVQRTEHDLGGNGREQRAASVAYATVFTIHRRGTHRTTRAQPSEQSSKSRSTRPTCRHRYVAPRGRSPPRRQRGLYKRRRRKSWKNLDGGSGRAGDVVVDPRITRAAREHVARYRRITPHAGGPDSALWR